MIKYKIDILSSLNNRGYSTYKLVNNNIFGNATLQNFRKNKVVYGSTLDKLCKLLNCQPGDILEYIPDEEDTNTNTNKHTQNKNGVEP